MSQSNNADFLNPSEGINKDIIQTDLNTDKDQSNGKDSRTSRGQNEMTRILEMLESTINRLNAVEEKMKVQEKEQGAKWNKGEPSTKGKKKAVSPTRKREAPIGSLEEEPPKKRTTTTSVQLEQSESESSEVEIDRPLANDFIFETLSDIDAPVEEEEEESLDSFFTAKEVVGKKVSDSLALSINNALVTVVEDTKIKELCDSVTRPENCKNLVVPKTNECIWKSITSQQRGRDRKLQKTQMLAVKSLSKLTETLDSVRESGKTGALLNLKVLEQNLKDTIKLTVATYSDINLKRLENIQPKLPSEYKSLCKKPFMCNNDNDKTTELLFGKDLNQKIKEKNEEEKFNRQLSTPKNLKSPRHWMSEPRADQRAQSSRGRKSMGYLPKRGGPNKRKFH